MELTKEQKIKIEKIGKKFDLKLMVLYGSYAKGTPRKESDLDIAILGKGSIDFETEMKIYSDLADIFGDNENKELDLVNLEKKDPLFLYQIAKNSRLLYGDLTDYNEFRAFAFKNYFDSNDIFQLEKKLVLKYQDYLNKTYVR